MRSRRRIRHGSRRGSGTAVIITAAGSSTRFGNSEKKEYYLAQNKPILVHTLEVFLHTGLFSTLVITIPAGHKQKVTEILSPYINPLLVTLVAGGNSRQASVHAGLDALDQQANPPVNVLIHDGARPWVSSALVRQVLDVTDSYGACIPVLDTVNALVRVDEQGQVVDYQDRNSIKAVQTPQGFHFATILEAHRQARAHGIQAVDDASLCCLVQQPVYTVPGELENVKITYRQDLENCGGL